MCVHQCVDVSACMGLGRVRAFLSVMSIARVWVTGRCVCTCPLVQMQGCLDVDVDGVCTCLLWVVFGGVGALAHV